MNTPNVKKPIRIIAIGISRKGEPFQIKAINDESIGIRAAAAGVTADKLTLAQLAGHAAAMEATHADIHAFANMLALDTGKGAHTLGYSTVGEQSDERRQVIIDQVRMAKNQDELNAALEAAYWYDPSVYQCMRNQYGDKFGGNS